MRASASRRRVIRKRARRLLIAVVAIVGTIAALSPGSGRAGSPPGTPGAVWVTNQTLNDIVGFDAQTGEVLAHYPVGVKPIGIVALNRTGKVYVTNEGSDTVSVIDMDSGDASEIPVGPGPHHLVPGGGGRLLAFGEFESNTIGVIDTTTNDYRQFVASADPHAMTHAVWVGRQGHIAYVVNSMADSFTAIDLDTGDYPWFDFPTGDQPSEVIVTRNGKTAYLSARAEDQIEIYDLTGALPVLTDEISVGDQPDTLSLTHDGKTLVVALRGQPAVVDLINTKTHRVTPVPIQGAKTTGHQWLSLNGRVTFVAIESDTQQPAPGVAVINNRKAEVVTTYVYPGGGRPHGVFYLPPPHGIEGHSAEKGT